MIHMIGCLVVILLWLRQCLSERNDVAGLGAIWCLVSLLHQHRYVLIFWTNSYNMFHLVGVLFGAFLNRGDQCQDSFKHLFVMSTGYCCSGSVPQQIRRYSSGNVMISNFHLASPVDLFTANVSWPETGRDRAIVNVLVIWLQLVKWQRQLSKRSICFFSFFHFSLQVIFTPQERKSLSLGFTSYFGSR